MTEDGIAHIIMPTLIVAIVVAIGGYVYLNSSHAATTCYAQQWQQNSSGQCVKDIQNLLNYQLYGTKSSSYLSVDGSFGSYTKAAVEQEQKNNSITANGIVATQTWTALCASSSLSTAPSWYTAAASNAGCPTPTSSGGGGSGGTGGSGSSSLPYASALSGYTTLAQSYTGQQIVSGSWAANADESKEGGNTCNQSDVTYDSTNSAADLTTNGLPTNQSGASCAHIRSEYTVPTKNSVIESKILMPGTSSTAMLDWGSFWTDGAIKADTSDNKGLGNENWPVTGEVDAVETQFGQSYISIHCGCMADYNASSVSPTEAWTTEPKGWEDKDTTYATPTGTNIAPQWTVVDIAFNADNTVTIYYNGVPYVTVPASVLGWNTGYAYVNWGISGAYAAESQSSWPTGIGSEEVQYMKVFTK